MLTFATSPNHRIQNILFLLENESEIEPEHKNASPALQGLCPRVMEHYSSTVSPVFGPEILHEQSHKPYVIDNDPNQVDKN